MMRVVPPPLKVINETEPNNDPAVDPLRDLTITRGALGAMTEGTVFLSATYSHEKGLKMVDGLGEGAAKAVGGPLNVGNDVYIGANCVIMPVTVGEGAIIGAGSFVNKDLDPWGIYAGSPAKKIGEHEH